jgi:hypothetical protein
LDETIFAHTTTLNIKKMSKLKSIPKNTFAYEVTFNDLELQEGRLEISTNAT